MLSPRCIRAVWLRALFWRSDPDHKTPCPPNLKVALEKFGAAAAINMTLHTGQDHTGWPLEKH